MNYDDFVGSKRIEVAPSGFEPGALNPKLFDYQRDITRWAIRRGKAALFQDCGLGKSFEEWEFAKQVAEHTNKPVLLVSPLSVGEQMAVEAPQFGHCVNLCRSGNDIKPGINITNYEMIHKFDPSVLGGIVLDESSILKGGSLGKMSNDLVAFARDIPYRLCATATPSPNDIIELTFHAEFLGIMREAEIKALFFTQDGNSSNKFRLKRNAVENFYKWLASWAVAMRKPSDLGYSDEGFELPELIIEEIVIDSSDQFANGTLFQMEARGITEQRIALRNSIEDRVNAASGMVNTSNDQWLVWCQLNDESQAIAKAIPSAVEVKGSDSAEHKVDAAMWFREDVCKCEQGNKLKNPVERGNLKIETMSESTGKPGQNRETLDSENFTPLIQNGDAKQQNKLKNGSKTIQKSDWRKNSKNSELHQTNIERCLTSKAEFVQSAEKKDRQIEVEPEDCTLTMTIKPELSEDYCVQTATWDSESFKTIPSLSKKRCSICGKPNELKRDLVSKPSIFGFGMNFQHANHMIFCGMGNSFERYYQAIKRIHRFGQKRKCHVYVIVTPADGAVVENIKRKWRQNDEMFDNLVKHMAIHTDLGQQTRHEMEYNPTQKVTVPAWMKTPVKTKTQPGMTWINMEAIPYQFDGVAENIWNQYKDLSSTTSMIIPQWIETVEEMSHE